MQNTPETPTEQPTTNIRPTVPLRCNCGSAAIARVLTTVRNNVLFVTFQCDHCTAPVVLSVSNPQFNGGQLDDESENGCAHRNERPTLTEDVTGAPAPTLPIICACGARSLHAIQSDLEAGVFPAFECNECGTVVFAEGVDDGDVEVRGGEIDASLLGQGGDGGE